MKKLYSILLSVFTLFLLLSCGTSHSVYKHPKKSSKTVLKTNSKSSTIKKTHTSSNNKSISLLIDEAEKYKGTPYLYGGNTHKGIDCSGLIHNVFQSIDITIPRQSSQIAQKGIEVPIKNAQIGDLIFFNTTGKGISHVGIIHSFDSNGIINFIHASSSQGVTITSLNNSYWKPKFVKIKRIDVS